MKKILDWLIDKWLAGFLTTSFYFLLKLYFDQPKDNRPNFFSFEWLNTLIHYPIQLWFVIILIAFIILMFKIKYRKTLNKNKDTKKPNHNSEPAMQYREDIFGTNDAKWVWDYDWDQEKEQYLVKDVTPLCPVCNSTTEIDTRPYSVNTADCHRCRLEGRNSSVQLQQYKNDVMKEIIRRFNSGEWRKKEKTT